MRAGGGPGADGDERPSSLSAVDHPPQGVDGWVQQTRGNAREEFAPEGCIASHCAGLPLSAAVAEAADTPLRVPSYRIKAAYAVGQVAYSGGFEAALGFIFFYYTAVLGLSGAAVGLALAISLAVDAVVDPLIGSMSDALRGRLGRRLPVMIAAIPLMAIAMILLFSPPTGLQGDSLFLWLAVTATGTRSAISLFSVPYTALGAELADGYAERSRVVAWRTLVGILSNVIVVMLAFNVFLSGKEGLQHRAGYAPMGLAIAAFMVLGTTLCCLGLRNYAASLPRPSEQPAPMIRRLPGELAEIFANRSFRLLFTSAVIFYVAIGANGALGSHTNVFVWRLTAPMLQILALAVLAGVLVGVPLAAPLQKLMEKKALVIIGVAMILVAWTVTPVLRVLGLFDGGGAEVMGPLIVQSVFGGIGIGLAVIAYPSMMADAADEHELLFGHRREGLYFAGLGFAGKAASGVGTLLGGLALDDLIGFPRDPKAHLALASSRVLLNKLILGWGPLPAFISLFSLALLTFYSISRRRHDEISAALRARR